MFEGWAAGIAAVGVGAGLYESSQATSAANTQANAANNAQQISQQEFNTITQQEQPFVQSGYGALSQLDYLLGVGQPTGGYSYGAGGSASTPGAPGSPGMAPGTTMGWQQGPTGQWLPPSNQYGLHAGQYGSLSSAVPTSNTPQGYDPSSGYQIGPGGGINQLIPGGSAPPAGSASTAGAAGSTAGGFGSLLTPFTAQNWQQLSPDYNFTVRQGQQGVLNSDSAGAGALSGSAQKDLINYNQNAANQSFNNAFNQYQTQQGNIFSRLSGIAQLGQAAATNTGQQGTALAGQAAQSATNIGTAQAAGQIGAANAIGGALSNAAPWLAYGGGGGGGSGTVSISPDQYLAATGG